MQNTRTKQAAELVVWHLTDSALPTGGFAHSAGLETFIQADIVHNPETYGKWLHGYLRQATYNEALAVRLAHELASSDESTEQKTADLAELDQLLHACQTARQVRASMNSMGKRWARISAIVAPDDELVAEYKRGVEANELRGNPGIAAGLVLGAYGVDKREAVAAYLMQMANSMTQNAIRAIPLGQDAGQRVLVGAYAAVAEATELTMTRTMADLGVVAPRLEIAQFEHEALRSRMFMS